MKYLDALLRRPEKSATPTGDPLTKPTEPTPRRVSSVLSVHDVGLRENSETECRLYVPAPDPVTVREVLGTAPAAADLEALHHELACALWDLRERCAGRQAGGGAILVRGRRLADWLRLDDVAAILRGHSGGVR